MEMFLLYLVFVLDALKNACVSIVIGAIICSCLCLVLYALYEDDGLEEIAARAIYVFKYCFATLIIAGIICIFAPSKEQVAVIYFGPKIYNGTLDVVKSEKLGVFGDKLFKVLEKKLDEELNLNGE